jgi:hypothetical protein
MGKGISGAYRYPPPCVGPQRPHRTPTVMEGMPLGRREDGREEIAPYGRGSEKATLRRMVKGH